MGYMENILNFSGANYGKFPTCFFTEDRPMENEAAAAACSNGCAECERHKHRSKEEYRSLTNRLNRIEGQIRGIRQMVDDERYCVDILTQVSAVQSALNAFNRELLTRHIKSCVTEDIKNGNDAAVDELCATLQKLMK